MAAEPRRPGPLARLWARLVGRPTAVSPSDDGDDRDAAGDGNGGAVGRPADEAPDQVSDAATGPGSASPGEATDAGAAEDLPEGAADRPRVEMTERTPAGGEPPNEPVWATGAELPGWEQPPRLEGEVHAELCVVGLGGSGLAAVAEALDAGESVVGIDAGPIAGRAAGRNGGFLLAGTALFHHDAVRRYGRERALAWYRGTVDEIARMAALDPEVRRVGSLRLAADDQEAADVERQLAVMRADGLAAEAWEPSDEAGIGPGLGEDPTGLFVPDDAVANPLARCRRLAARCMRAGAQLFTDSPATTVSGTRVTTPHGVVHCDAVVVAVDGVLGAVLPELASRVRPVRLQMLGTAPTDEVSVPRPVYARWGLDYWSQAEDGRIALGGGRDQGGDEEEAARPEPSAPVQEHLEGLLRDRVGVAAPITHRWAATVGFTESGLPICEQVRPGVWAIGGYSGTGNVIGAMLGRIAVELAVSGSSDRADVLFDT